MVEKNYALVSLKDGNPFVNERVMDIIGAKTPANEIDKRPDGFDYVRVGYVRRTLDNAFPASWDIEYEQMTPWDVVKATRQLVVKATLSIRNPLTREVILVKQAFGGGPMKVYAKGKVNKDGLLVEGLPIDFGNDYKSAGADALKKAASMLGICADVYEPVVEQREDERKTEAVETAAQTAKDDEVLKIAATEGANVGISKDIWLALISKAKPSGMTHEALLAFAKNNLKVTKPSEILGKQLPEILKYIESGVPF